MGVGGPATAPLLLGLLFVEIAVQQLKLLDLLRGASASEGRRYGRDPLPFRLERARRTISIGFFSRLREINPESSFSVLG